MVVAATGDDEDNLVISLLAKQEFAVPRVIARVNHPKNEWLFNENWGVDLSVSTPHLITALVEEAVTVGAWCGSCSSKAARRASWRSPSPTTPPRSTAPSATSTCPATRRSCAIVRDEHVVMPRGDTVFEAGDEVLAMVTPGVGGRGPPDPHRRAA